MTEEHPVEYRGFDVPESILNGGLFQAPVLAAFKHGVDTVLDQPAVPLRLDPWVPMGVADEIQVAGSLLTGPALIWSAPIPEEEDGYLYFERDHDDDYPSFYRIAKGAYRVGDGLDEVVDAYYQGGGVGAPYTPEQVLSSDFLVREQGRGEVVSVKRSQVPVSFQKPAYNSTKYEVNSYSGTYWVFLDSSDRALYHNDRGQFVQAEFSEAQLKSFGLNRTERAYTDPAQFKWGTTGQALEYTYYGYFGLGQDDPETVWRFKPGQDTGEYRYSDSTRWGRSVTERSSLDGAVERTYGAEWHYRVIQYLPEWARD